MKIFPDHIKKIVFIAPCGIPDLIKVKNTANFLESTGYEIVIKSSVINRTKSTYLASSLKNRLLDIHSCWKDKTIDMIIAVRGGYGSAQLLPYLDWALLRKRNIPFLGYSDLSAIQLAFYSQKIGIPISAPMIQNFSILEEDDYTKNSLMDVFKPQQTLLPLPGKKFNLIKKGTASGKLIPVTLSVFVTLIGTKYLPDMKNSILLLEDINEPIYKLDRYFTQLKQTNILSKISGLLLGSFKQCGNQKERLQLFMEISKDINGPVLMNIPFGHSYPRISVAFGVNCTIDNNTIVLSK